MNINKFDSGDFYQGSGGAGSPGGNDSWYYAPRWEDFTLDDETRARKRFSRFFLATFIYMLVSYVLVVGAQAVIMLLFDEARAEELLSSYTVILLINLVAMYCIAFPILYLMVRGMRSVMRTKSTVKPLEFFGIFLVAEAFMYFGNLVGTYLNTFISLLTGAEINNSVADMVENTPLWLIIVMVVIIGPVVEELIFRKLFFDKLGHYGDRLVIVVSAIAFGLFHGNLYQFFYATLLGLVLGYLYSRTANILYPIALHMLLNFFGSVIPLFVIDEIERFTELSEIVMSGGSFDEAEYAKLAIIVFAYSVFELALVVAGTVIFFKKRKSIFVSDRCEVLIPKQKRVSVILKNVGAILFVILMGLMMLSEIVMPIIENINSLPAPNPDTPPVTDGSSENVGEALIWLVRSIVH